VVEHFLDTEGVRGSNPLSRTIPALNGTKANTLFKGYMKEMTADLGEHGPEYLFVNNVGCPMTA
jgi:hypothetical protein